ncbi:hypothetical protein MCEMSHM24_02379 [Comamonadaceae bacterium]
MANAAVVFKRSNFGGNNTITTRDRTGVFVSVMTNMSD